VRDLLFLFAFRVPHPSFLRVRVLSFPSHKNRQTTFFALKNCVTAKYAIIAAYTTGNPTIHLDSPARQALTAELALATEITPNSAPVVS
jgi:hypothetical protein